MTYYKLVEHYLLDEPTRFPEFQVVIKSLPARKPPYFLWALGAFSQQPPPNVHFCPDDIDLIHLCRYFLKTYYLHISFYCLISLWQLRTLRNNSYMIITCTVYQIFRKSTSNLWTMADSWLSLQRNRIILGLDHQKVPCLIQRINIFLSIIYLELHIYVHL